MHDIYELKEMLMKELEEYGRKGELTGGSLEVVDKLAHTIKNICKIIESAEEEEYSMTGSYAGGGQSGGSYARGGRGGGQSRNSYARGRGGRRDSRGRYSGEGMSRYSREGYSQEGSEELAEMLRSMMSELPQNVQMDAQRLADKLEQSMR